MSRTAATLSLLLAVAFSANAADEIYQQTEDIVYGDSDGVGLLMDVFVPVGHKNGFGIVDIASGAWHSDRGKIRDHQMARMYDHFCTHGYTVFAVRPGSVTRYTSADMLANIKQGIRYIKENAATYSIDANRLGITGASAGGHLTLMTLVAGAPENESIAAAGVFFPPTDFTNWGGPARDLKRLSNLFFLGGMEDCEDEAELLAKAKEQSPGLLITKPLPPMILFHGDADNVVPLQQSEFLVEQLNKVGSKVDFFIEPGGAHPWMSIHEEVKQMAEWFDLTLGVKPAGN